MTSKSDFLTDFLMYFRQKSDRCAPCRPPPLLLSFTAITDHPRVGEVRPCCGPKSGAAPVGLPIGFRSGLPIGPGGFAVRPVLSPFLSGLLVPHRSGHVPKTGGLYSAVTHHTRHSLRRPGSFNLDLVSRPLLVRSEV
jgi:hypothetical protein